MVDSVVTTQAQDDPEVRRKYQALREATFRRYLEQEAMNPVPKPSWTFPSPFVPYAIAPEARHWVCWGPQPRTLAELRMYALSWAIRCKLEWQRKASDPSIMEKWRVEALNQQEALPIVQKLTPNMIDYVLAELISYAKLSDPVTGIEPGPFDAIWYSDRLVPVELADRLRTAAAKLENVPDASKDWHPGSNGQVLDLVHPSLYCIVYERTCFSDLTLPKPPTYESPASDAWRTEVELDPVSDKFCWLPSDFYVDRSNGAVTLVSPYINNIHPFEHRALYPVLESVLGSFIPLFEHVLSQINGQDQDLYRKIPPGSGRMKTEMCFGTWAGYNDKYCGDTIPCIWSKRKVTWEEGMTDAEFDQLQEEAPKALPEALETYNDALERTMKPYSLRGKTIQCIIKLANIHLTPENPVYKGGSWHIEAMLNEHIVASGIYYYEEENISESRLAFRVTTGPPVYHKQDDELCMDILYGLKRDKHCYQDIGSIATTAGRALAWPNIYQHRVAPFHLLDAKKPGHRKILAIFLVDPSIEPIPSATNIPPQQKDWILDALMDGQTDPQSLLSRPPPEVLNLVVENLDTVMTRAEAEQYRLELMQERTGFIKNQADEYSYVFNMCEH
ncbi:hypothetical protein R3P38DRAFT_2852317 [Favolaschia claudopus]|uniref:Uncharacterized protein n=1 Tax=Favolaschia claudopus TaxID=2862362 RepID=A0AAW0DP96_9AGAR